MRRADAAAAAPASLRRLADLAPRVVVPAHGSIPTDHHAAFATALRRAQRLVDDPAGAVWYGARRIFAFALMIRSGIPADEVEPYLHERAWLIDAARLLNSTSEALAAELVDGMVRATDGSTPPPSTHPGLSRREQEVCLEVLAGFSTTGIPTRLFLSPHTVQDHLKAVFHKLGVRSRGEPVARLRPES